MTHFLTLADPSAAISTINLFEASIPRTNDFGDALLAAQRILNASYMYCLDAGDEKIPEAVRFMVMSARNEIGKQYAEYLKGG